MSAPDIHALASSASLSQIRLALASGVEVTTPGPCAQTVLHIAVQSSAPSSDELVTYLLHAHAANLLELTDDTARTALHWAAATGCWKRTGMLVEAGAAVYAADHEGMTPLHLAAAAGRDRVVALLLSLNTRVDLFNTAGATALHEAVRNAHEAVAELLLSQHPGLVHAPTRDGTPPLMLATRSTRGSGMMMQLLLARGADLTWADRDGNTALHVAVLANNICCVRTLLNSGADPFVRNLKGYTPLHLAAITEKVHTLNALLESSEALKTIDLPDCEGATALHWAATKGNVELVSALQAMLANKNLKDAAGSTPLHEAVTNNHYKVVMRLLEKLRAVEQPTAVCARDNAGATALHYAAVDARVDIIRMLVLYGADVEQADGEGNRALHWAVLQGAQAGVECLVAEGAHVDARGKGGRTALHHAVASKQLNIIRTLHCLRAQLELRDDLQRTPLLWAVATREHDTLRYLVQCGADVNAADGGGCTGLHHAALTDDSAAASILCSSFGVDKDAPDNLGNTPLHTAAAAGCLEAAEVLVACGLALEAVNREGATPLFVAAQHGDTGMTRVLLSHGADFTFARPHDGRTILHAAAQHPGTLQWLLDNTQADATRMSDAGMLPLDEAVAAGACDSVDVLMTSMGAGPVRWQRRESVLHAAARLGSPALCALLAVTHPQLLRAQATGGFTPLHTAAHHMRLACVKELLRLSHEADIDVQDEEGNTVLHYAVMNEKLDLIKLLLVSGACRTVINAELQTPFSLAANSPNDTIVNLFLGHNLKVQQRLMLAPAMLMHPWGAIELVPSSLS